MTLIRFTRREFEQTGDSTTTMAQIGIDLRDIIDLMMFAKSERSES